MVANPPAAIQTLIDTGFTAEQVAEFKIRPIGQLEKLVGRKELPDLIGQYIEKKEGKPALVADSDPRPPISRAASAAEDFG